jgi:hypothetical protein
MLENTGQHLPCLDLMNSPLLSHLPSIPLLMSYHTHLPMYAKIYLPVPGSVALANFLLNTVLNHADLTLVTSPQLKEQVISL